MTLEQLRLRSGDLTFDAVASGPADGPVVLLLHGFPQSSWSWRGVWPALATAGFRVVAPDLRGYSPDARPADVQAYAMPQLVGDVLGVLDHLGVEQAHVVGHDWGAAIAWHTAGRHPERVSTLTAVSVPHPLAFVAALTHDADQRQRSAYMRDWRSVDTEQRMLAGELANVFGGVPTVDAEHYLARMREPGALTAALAYYRAQSRTDLAGLGPITMPTLHVWSDQDAALGRAGAEATAAQVSGPYRFEVFEGISHWVPEQAGERLAGVLLEHLGPIR